MMRLYTPPRAIYWRAKSVKFNFYDPARRNAWLNRPMFNFSFNARQAWDDGISILVDAGVPKDCSYPISPPLGTVQVHVGEDDLQVSALVRVLVSVKPDLDMATLQHWEDKLGGASAAVLSIDGYAHKVDDGLSGFALVSKAPAKSKGVTIH